MTQPSSAAALPYLAKFTIWSEPLGALPDNAPERLAKMMFITSVLKCLQMDAPEFAGAIDPAKIDRIRETIYSLDAGDTILVHRLAISVLSYAESEATPRFSFRIACLDADQPLLMEFDTPFGSEAADDDWDAGTVAIQILALSEAQAFAHPVLRSIIDFLDLSIDDAKAAISEALDDDSPGTLLQAYLEDEGERQASKTVVAIREARAYFESTAEANRAQEKRDLRRLERFNESLKQQLDTSQAIAGRHKQRADDLAKQLRTQAGASVQPAQAQAIPGARSADPEELEALRVQVAQQRSEIDSLRADLHRANLRIEAMPTKITAVPTPSSIPTTFEGMQAWIERNLDASRVLVHPKALRAARKSVFREPALAYRTLQAINDFYWPMKMGGDADAARKWEEFLRRERLTFGSTGAAFEDHRTRDSYKLTYQKQLYPMDLHVQGSNSRKEEDCFRLYFHASKDIGKVLVGHFPTHLPNTYD